MYINLNTSLNLRNISEGFVDILGKIIYYNLNTSLNLRNISDDFVDILGKNM